MWHAKALRRHLAGLLLVFAAAPVAAEVPLDEILARLRAGAFLEAAELGEADGSAAGLALAAKAHGYHARCTLEGRPDEQKPHFQRTYDLAVKAIELDPSEAEAWIQRARGYARLLRYDRAGMGLREAMKVVERLGGYLDRAVALAGDRAEPLMARGRVEVGKLVASRELFFGAFSAFGNRNRALGDLCAAIDRVEAGPAGREATLVYYTVAEGLWKLDPQSHAGLAAAYLDRALAPCDDDAICVCIQQDARALRRTIDAAHPGGLPPAQRVCPAR